MKFLSRLPRAAGFAVYFVRILIIANWQVAVETLRPQLKQSPRMVRYKVTGMTDLQITCLANAITLTPGTLVVDISDDRRFLYVHCMFGASREDAIRDLDDLRRRLLRGLF